MSGAVISPSLKAIGEAFPQDDSAFWARLILTLPGLFIALSAPFAGLIADKVGRVKLLIGSLILYAVAGSGGLWISELWLLLASRAALGLAVGGLMTAVIALVGDYYEGPARGKFLGQQASFMAMGGVVIVLIGGLLADISWRHPFLIYLFSVAFLPMVIFFVREPSAEDKAGHSGGLPENVDAHKQRTLVILYATALISMILFYVVITEASFLLEQLEPGISKSRVGLAITCTTFVSGLTSLCYRYLRRWMSYQGGYVLCFGFIALGYLTIHYASSVGGFMVGAAIGGIGMGLMMPNSSTWLLSLSTPVNRGRLTGLLTAAVFMGQFLSPIATRPLDQLFTIQGTFLVSSLVAAGVSIAYLIWELGLRRNQPQGLGVKNS